MKTEYIEGKKVEFNKVKVGVYDIKVDGKLYKNIYAKNKEDLINIIKNKIKNNINKNKIKLVRVNTENHYSISSDNTIYVKFNKTFVYDIDIDELISKRKQLIKKLRSLKIKVKTKTNDDILLSHRVKFKENIKERKKIEKEVIIKFDKIYKEGLYVPTSDNVKLNEAQKLSWELDKFLYRNQSISLINEIKSEIDEIYNNFYRDENYYKNYTMVAI